MAPNPNDGSARPVDKIAAPGSEIQIVVFAEQGPAARIGYAFSPAILGYVKGGAAWERQRGIFGSARCPERPRISRGPGYTVGAGSNGLRAAGPCSANNSWISEPGAAIFIRRV